MLNKFKIGIKSDKDKQQTKSEKKTIPKKLNSLNVESIAKSMMKDGNHHILNLDCTRLEASNK